MSITFSFLGVSFLLTAFLKSINASLTQSSIFSFLVLLTFYKYFSKNIGFWFLKYSLNISVFIFISLYANLFICINIKISMQFRLRFLSSIFC